MGNTRTVAALGVPIEVVTAEAAHAGEPRVLWPLPATLPAPAAPAS